MFTSSAHQAAHSQTAARPRTAVRNAGGRIRRFGAVLAAAISGLLAFAAIAPAAMAMQVPVPDSGGGASGVTQVPATTGVGPAPVPTVRVIAMGGMAGWQIALIAFGAALVAAGAAVLLYRALTARKAAAATA